MIFEFLISILFFIVAYGVAWSVHRNNYWKRKNVPYVPSYPLIGHFSKNLLLQEHTKDTFDRLYNHEAAKGQPFVGVNVFHKPAILVRDPELIKRILIKDFSYFNNRHNGADPIHDPIGANNLFQIKNPTWRKLRLQLTPVFTSGKMKQMFYMIEKVSSDLKEHIGAAKGKPLNAQSLFGCFISDIIALVAFGTEANCLKSPETSEFLRNAQIAAMSSTWSKISFAAKTFLPELFRFFKMSTFHPDFAQFLRKMFNEVTANRIKSGQVRDDLIDALIAIKNSEGDEALYTEDVLLAQATVFLAAGYETSTSTLVFTFYQLCKDRHIQDRLRKEIKDCLVKNNGKVSYDNLVHDLPYLDCVLQETLRMFPPVAMLDRECVTAGYGMEPYSKYKLPKLLPIFIPVAALQMDPEYFPNPEKYDPSRFEGKYVSEYTYMPFGLGPRNCIGERFSRMQTKFAILTVLRSFSVSFADTTVPKVEMDKTCILGRFNGHLMLNFTPDELNLE